MERNTLPRAAIVIGLLAVSLVIIYLKISVSTDLKLFLPEPSNHAERLLHHQLDNGASTKLVFVALTGLPTEQLAEANTALSKRLSETNLFSKVVNQATELGQEGLDFVIENRYLLSRSNLSDTFTQEGFNKALEDRIRGLTSLEAGLEKKHLRRDPTGEVITLLQDWQGKLSKHSRPEVLHGLWFSSDHKRTLILAEIGAALTSLDNQIEAISAVRNAFDEIKIPGLEIIMTGPAAFAVESGEDIKSDVRLLTWLAVICVTLFLLLVYRSVVMLLLVFAPLIAGVIVATASILFIHDQIHGITLAFGITLAGVAVDYPIHLLTGLTRAKDRDMTYVGKIWPTLRLGVISTVFAYCAFLLSGFAGLQQLGLFTIIGLTTAALFSRWVLPLLLQRNVERRQGLAGFHRRLVFLAGHAAKARYLVVIFGVTAAAGLWLTSLPVMHLNVDSLSPIKDSRRAEGKMLRDDLGYWYGGRMLVLSASDKDAILQKSEAIEPFLDQMIQDKQMTGFDMAAQFLPSVDRQEENLAAFSNPEQIQQDLTAALSGSNFKPAVFKPFIDQLETVAKSEPISIDNLIKGDLGKRLQTLVFDFEDEAAGVVLLHGVTDETRLRSFAEKQEGVMFMHLKTSATELVARSVDRVALTMILCIVGIYMVMSWSFKSLTRPFKIMIPTFAAAVVTAGLLVAFNSPLSIFHLISLMLVIGLGLDYALFFNRLPGNSEEWNTTFKSLWVCGCTTVLVFGILVLSQTPPLKAIGLTVGIGAALSILFAAMWATKAEKQT